MGMIAKWREKRRRHGACLRAAKLMDERFAGKGVDELMREGGWDVLASLHGWSKASDVWSSFTNAEMERLVLLSSVVYSCVRKICLVMPDAFMEVGMWDGDDWQPDENHAALNLLRQPNPAMDWRTWTWSYESHRLLTGESYVWKKRNPGGDIIELYTIPTSWIVKEIRRGELLYYEIILCEGVRQRVLPEDMFVGYYPDPSNPTRGAGPMQAALKDYQIDDQRATMMMELLTNMHFSGAILKSEHSWTTEQKDEMRRILRDVIGPGKRANPLFLEGERSSAEFPQPPSDIDWPGTAGLAESRICAAFGVPPILVGLRVGLDASTYSNYDQAKKAFYQDTMRPTWDWLASTLERGLFRSEGEEDEVEAAYDHIPELQENLDEKHTRVREDFHGGLLELDQALELLGYETVGGDGGKVRLLNMSLVEWTPGVMEPVPPMPEHTGEPPQEGEPPPESPNEEPEEEEPGAPEE